MKDKLLKETNEKSNQQQEEWESARVTLENRCSEVDDVSKQRRLDLLIAQGKLLQTEAESNALINDLRKTMAAKQFRASISQEKVRAILKRHKLNTLKMVKSQWIKVGRPGRLKQPNFNYYGPTGKI